MLAAWPKSLRAARATGKRFDGPGAVGHHAAAMGLALPLAAFTCAWGACRTAFVGDGWRRSFVKASVLCGCWLVLSTELLSVTRSLTLPGIAVCWLAFAGVAAWVWFRSRSKSFRGGLAAGAFLRSPSNLAGAGFLAFLAAATLVTALAAPVNSWDSMTYHLPRVAHWIQNGSVDFYPTHVIRQLVFGPLAEFGILHLQILTGSDANSNLVQWFAFVGSGVAASLISAQLGATPRGQLIAAAFACSFPSAVLEASGTLNDCVITFWFLVGCHFALDVVARKADRERAAPAWFAASVGLAILTKGSAYFFFLPLVVWAVGSEFASGRARGLRCLATVGFAVIALNGAQLARTWSVFGTPVQVPAVSRPPPLAFSGVASNFLRNAAVHLGSSFEPANQVVEKAARGLHSLFGIDPDDRRFTLPMTRFSVPATRNHENDGRSLTHVVFAWVAFALLFRGAHSAPERRWLPYFGALAAGGFLISTFQLWQEGGGRLHAPLIVALGAIVGLWAGSFSSKVVPLAVIGALAIPAVPAALWNEGRPLFGQKNLFNTDRREWAFERFPALRTPYVQAMNELSARGCRQVGLALEGDAWEYPLWALGRSEPIAVEHVNVQNRSRSLDDSAQAPCAIVDLNFKRIRFGSDPLAWVSPPPEETVQVRGAVFRKIWSAAPITLFVR